MLAGSPQLMTGFPGGAERGHYDGTMSEPAIAPRNAFHGVVAVWIASLVIAVTLGIVLPDEVRVGWLLIAFGGVVLCRSPCSWPTGARRGSSCAWPAAWSARWW